MNPTTTHPMNPATAKPKSRYDTDEMQAGASLLSAATITGDDVYNMRDENLGM